MSEGSEELERWGWKSDLPRFYGTEPDVVRDRLAHFVREPGASQLRAWKDAIPWLQDECRELVRCDDFAKTYTTLLEYELPREARRPDVILLENGAVVVLELKGRSEPRRADIDQVAAYARDLRCYHAECANRPVIPILVPTQARGPVREIDGVKISGRDGLHQLLLECTRDVKAPPISVEAFVRPDAYAPLPSLVRAARDLFAHQALPKITRASAATDPAVDQITAIAHEAAKNSTRHLVLVCGVPGSGKTLVGMRLVHADFVDRLAVQRGGHRPSAPSVFLSGNGPLVQVLQDALKGAGGGGKTFVRDVRDFIRFYSRDRSRVPPEHILVFDEAQRAWDAAQVERKHSDTIEVPKSEPEHFIEIANRVPGWCVVVGLIGTGQEIHTGEQAGVVQWRHAVEACVDPSSWTVHAPPGIQAGFAGCSVRTAWDNRLNLDTQLRFHLAGHLHAFVEAFIGEGPEDRAARQGASLWNDGYRLLVTRSIDQAREHLQDRFRGEPQARYGLLASSKAKGLVDYEVDNRFQSTRFPVGPWYNAPTDDAKSCCQLRDVATEFSSQGLELDMALLAWGTDFLRENGLWTARYSGKTKFVPDTLGLRRNVYRVLLTRGREGTVIFVPTDSVYDETHASLLASGARPLD